MKNKRANNGGSVYQRADGRWVASVSIGGKRISRYAPTEIEAFKKLEKLLNQVTEQLVAQEPEPPYIEPVAKVPTLSEWVDQWLSFKTLRPSTRAMYLKTISYVLRYTAAIPITELTPLLLTQTFARLLRETEAERQLNLAHGYLKACLEQAVDFELLAANPMKKVPKPRWEQSEQIYWTVEQTKRFIETGLTDERYWHPLFVFLVSTGMRISEALGLCWKDMDWKNSKVRIERGLVWAGQEWSIERPKTKAGARWVTLTGAAIEALHKLPDPTSREDPIFRTHTGEPPQSQNLRAYLIALCKLAEVPYVHVHGLRHVHAMLSLEVTDDPYAVQRRLGHANVRVTLAIYGYSRRDDKEVADGLNKLFEDGS